MRFGFLLVCLMVGGVMAMHAFQWGVPFLVVVVLYAIFAFSMALVIALVGVPRTAPEKAPINPFVWLGR